MTTAPKLRIEFTVSTTFGAEIDPDHFPSMPKPDGKDPDDWAEEVQRWFDRRWTDRDLLREYYARSGNWNGNDSEVEIDSVELSR